VLINLAAEHGLDLRALEVDDVAAYDCAVTWLVCEHPTYLNPARGCPHEAMRLAIGALKVCMQANRDECLARRLRRRSRIYREVFEGQRALFAGQPYKCCARCTMPKTFSAFACDATEADGYRRACRSCEAKQRRALRRAHRRKRPDAALALWRWLQLAARS
jgi:hypothetical protein